MKIAITTPTGKVGGALTDRLLEGNDVVLLARDASKLKPFADRGAAIETGSLDDEKFVTRATSGADVLFLVIPPDYSSNDYRSRQRQFGDAAVSAINTNKTPRVVMLSSVAAHLGDGFGPISGLGDVEKKLDGTDAAVTHFRPGFFMENLLMSLPSVVSDGAIYQPLPGSTALEMIAVADIADLGAQLVLDADVSGRRVVELAGPRLSFDDAADAIGDAIGKSVSHVEVTPGQAIEALMEMGVSRNVAEQYGELDAAIADDRIAYEGSPRRGKTTFREFAEGVFRPAYLAMNQ